MNVNSFDFLLRIVQSDYIKLLLMIMHKIRRSVNAGFYDATKTSVFVFVFHKFCKSNDVVLKF